MKWLYYGIVCSVDSNEANMCLFVSPERITVLISIEENGFEMRLKGFTDC